MVRAELAEELKMSIDALHIKNKFLILTGQVTGNGASAASTVWLGIVPYKKWRVVDVGFCAVVGQANTVAEVVTFGFAGDALAADVDVLGVCSLDTTTGKNLAADDMVSRADPGMFATQDAEANTGTHAWTAGSPDHFNVWQSKQAAISCTKSNVGSSTATLIPYAVIEIG